jgi:hypothetical protein
VAPNKDEDTFGFYAIDVSLCSEVLVTTILHDYVADLMQYNIKAVNGGVDYVQAIEEKHLSPRFAPNKATNQEKSQGFDWKGVVTKIITASVSSLVFSAGALFQSIPSFLGHLSENDVNDIDPQTAQRIQDIQRILAAHQEQYGVNAFLEELGSKVIAELQKPVTKQISSLVIDAKNNYNPLLLEYNKKIELDPVKKTIYIFFLQHLEGIRLKDRPAYYQEFRQIYLNVVKTGEMNNIDKTLDAIVNLESNRFNEELSRINKEINKELAPKMADMYRIKGKRGDLYRIHLDKSKIHLPAVLKI